MTLENGLATRGPALVERHRAMVSSTLQKLAEPLSAEQYKALALLTEGEPIREAAKKAGVGKTTLYRWMKEDPQFRAAYNAWDLEQHEMDRITLQRCGADAVARIRQRVQSDEKLAFAVAKELGSFKPQKYQATDPRHARYEMALERWEQEEQIEERANRQLNSKRQRMLAELDMEEVMAQEDEEREREVVPQKAING